MVSLNIDDQSDYCYSAPFFPPANYPELLQWQCAEINTSNKVYANVRNCLKNMGLDKSNIGSGSWNPLGDIINPGNLVVIKPNLVMHHNNGSHDIRAVVTHASVIRPILDYVFLALKGTGTVIVGDAPQANANFNLIVERNGLRDLISWYKSNNMPIELIDFRKNTYPDGFTNGIKVELPGDPNGYICVDLENKSFLENLPHIEKLYGSEYDRKFIVSQHTSTHKYLLSGSILKADVIINIPKLKTHRKAGVTINAKNLVGANGDKNYLAHYRVGCDNGGDEYPPNISKLAKLCYKWNRVSRDYILIRNTLASRKLFNFLNLPFIILQKIYKTLTGKKLMDGFGDWYGNDTVWRMCLDLNQIILFADKDGKMHTSPQRKYFCIVDGIIAGEGDGPMCPSPKHSGLLACGINTPFETDYICIYLMGFSPDKLKINLKAQRHQLRGFNPADINTVCELNGNRVNYKDINLHFIPQHNWAGHIERE